MPRPPTPVHTPDAPGIRTWQQLECPPHTDDGCAAPTRIDHAGLMLRSVGGRRVVWRDRPGAVASLETKVPRSKAARWVLVGARYTGGAAHLVVMIGQDGPVSIPPDRLSLFALRGHGSVTVTVADLGKPFGGEVLRIEEYVGR